MKPSEIAILIAFALLIASTYGAGDPTGPNFIEVTDYNYFIVTGTGGLSISPSNK